MSGLLDATAPLSPTGNLRRRIWVSRSVVAAATLSAGVAVAVLGLIVEGVISRGAGALNWSFLTSNPGAAGAVGGGIASAIVGTALIVAFATLLAVPVGILCAVYLSELASPGSRFAGVLRLGLDLMQGLPTVIVGLFAFGLIVKSERTDSGFAGAVALSIIMLPLIARSSQEVLRLVPGTLREAADALGVPRWRALLGIVLPAASGGILTGVILAVARAAGETAPLLITDGIFNPGTTLSIFGHGVPNLPVTIFSLAEQPSPDGLTRAWGAALVLLAGILVANVGARMLLARGHRRIEG